MPSADDALAFLQSLTIGKEDQLREEAQRAGEERMESIMGGKPGTSPLRPPAERAAPPPPPPTPSPAPEPTPATPAAAPPADQLLSPNDALAFLQSLTVGKEDQLRDEAQRAGEARMDAIMGGKPGTSPLRPPAERAAPPPPPPPPAPEPEPAPDTMPPPLPVDDMLTAEQDALAFLSNLTAPSELDTVEIEIESRPKPVAPEPPAAHVVEEEEMEALVAATQSPSDFWLPTADDDGGEPLPANYFERAVQPAPAAPQPRTPPRKAETPARPVEPVVAPAAPSIPLPPPIGAEEFQSRLKADPADHEARLGLARVWWASGDREQSLRLYQQLVEDETFMSEVLGDLQRDLETFEHPDWYRVLGDAHMKVGNLSQALDAYRQALTHL
jgi:hypothetical protein